MVIDPGRFRRGQAGQFVFSKHLFAVAAVTLVGLVLPGTSRSQFNFDPSGTYQDAWRYSSSLSIDETWSDNINLLPAGHERSEFVTTISPVFQVSRSGPRLKLTFAYTPQYLYYAKGTNGASLRNSLLANADVALIENLLLFNANSTIAQANISPFGTQAANTVNGSTNRTEARTYSFGPTLQSRVSQDLSYSLGYRYTESDSGSSAIAASHINQLFGSLQTSTSFRDLGAGGTFSRTEQHFSGGEIITQSASTTLTYVLQPTIHLRASIGYDKDSYPTASQADVSGVAYSAGFDWEPTRHTTLNVTYGHRYFGPTASMVLSESMPLFSLTANYSRDQTTSSGNGLTQTANPNYQLLDQSLRATIPDPIARAQAVTTALQQNGLSTSPYATASFYTNQLYVQQSLGFSLSLNGLRNTVSLNASRSQSQGLSDVAVGYDIFSQSQKFRTTVYSANWNRPLGPRTNFNATFQKSKNQAIQGTGDTSQRTLTASINRQLSKNLSSSALFRNTVQSGSSDSSGFYSGNYRENAIFASLRVTF